MVTNVAFGGMSGSQYLRQAYMSQAGISDMTDDSLMGLNSLTGNYNLGLGMPSFGGLGCFGMYGPGSEVRDMTMPQYLKYTEDMESEQLKKQVRQKHLYEATNFSASAQENDISRQVSILNRKIKDNEQDSIFKEYKRLTDAVKEKFAEAGYTDIPDEQIKTEAERLYAEKTGKSLTNDLMNNGDSSFVYGLKQGAGFGLGSLFTNKNSAAKNLSLITGEDIPADETRWRYVGTAASAGLTLAAIPLIAKGSRSGALRKGFWEYLKWGFTKAPKRI